MFIELEKVVFQSIGIILVWSGKDYFILIFKTLKTLAAISIQLAFLLCRMPRLRGKGFKMNLKPDLPVHLDRLAEAGFISHELSGPALLFQGLNYCLFSTHNPPE